ncbi:hypothetical protein O7635_36475 [Asanoa sp. WMMD1127]|uniref:hypothetical protein n=1 Tax=Asanoa sp. WMMD1127 TaxID=3016107 RepID=UPI002415E700|nr:hypothetical protein [Asanoa sp. WMMD1127]MDG4827372.1 hypothetical protein [Asanoa sp. WMMD1127]
MDAESLFPDAATREQIGAQQRRPPLSYYEQRVPVPPGWDRRRRAPTCGSAGPVRSRRTGPGPAGHPLHHLVDPEAPPMV